MMRKKRSLRLVNEKYYGISDDLPAELIAQLSEELRGKDAFGEGTWTRAVRDCLIEAKTALTLNQLHIGIYRKTGRVISRPCLNSTVRNLRQRGYIEPASKDRLVRWAHANCD